MIKRNYFKYSKMSFFELEVLYVTNLVSVFFPKSQCLGQNL